MNKKAFTLLELLVVVLIIGILAAIALPQYKYAVAKAKFTQLLTTSKAIMEAQRRYMLIKGERSLDLSVLDIDIQGGTYGPNTYSEANLKDSITFNWGRCTITYGSGRQQLSCYLSKPYVSFLRSFNSEFKECCASPSSGEIGKKLCQTELPSAKGKTNNDTCGSGATLYQGY